MWGVVVAGLHVVSAGGAAVVYFRGEVSADAG